MGDAIKTEESAQSEVRTSEADLARIEAQGNTNALSRALAVMVLMFLPGVAGHYLDQWLGTTFLVMIGFILGICIAILGLLYVAKIADATAKRNSDRKKEIESQRLQR
jgi:F0F1-type ATP synthase assembly protein I